jgi:hemolysin activation/secretion protein
MDRLLYQMEMSLMWPVIRLFYARMVLMQVRCSICFSTSLLLICFAASGADVIAPGAERPGERRPELPEFLPDTPKPGVDVPPASPAARPSAPGKLGGFELRGVVFEGNTVFPNQDLDAVAKEFLGWVTLADLEELRYRLTRHYTDRGYINSGVILKSEQKIDDGVVVFQVMEGRLDEVRVEGTKRLRPDYVRKRIWPDPQQPFEVNSLQERFQLLLQDPLIERMDGKLRPGVAPGRAILDVDVSRARPWDLTLSVDNHRPPSTGAERALAAGVVRNLAGIGDYLEFAAGFSDGAQDGSAMYTIPLGARNSRLWMRYDNTDTSVVEEPLQDLDIESETETLELGFIYPLHRSLSRSLSLGLALAWRENETFLLDEPFSFSSGADEGETTVSVLRFTQEFNDRTSEQAFALRSSFSFGLDAFGSTVHADNRPDSRFVAWLGQAQYARRLDSRGTQLILRGDVQIASDELLSLERFAVGGVRTVRGYRENELVRDNGLVVSAELRFPLKSADSSDQPESVFQIAIFTDYGAAWDKGEDRDYLHSAGLGFMWRYMQRYEVELYIAHDIQEAEPKQDHDLQDDGVHFRLGINL